MHDFPDHGAQQGKSAYHQHENTHRVQPLTDENDDTGKNQAYAQKGAQHQPDAVTVPHMQPKGSELRCFVENCLGVDGFRHMQMDIRLVLGGFSLYGASEKAKQAISLDFSSFVVFFREKRAL